MKTWQSSERKCHICSLKESDSHSWVVESAGDSPGENWKKNIQTNIKLIEVRREFSRGDVSIFYVCSKCMLLLLIDENRAFYRYGFRIVETAAPEEEKKKEAVLEIKKEGGKIGEEEPKKEEELKEEEKSTEKEKPKEEESKEVKVEEPKEETEKED